MPRVHPFRAIEYARNVTGRDVSAFISPPYDVLDAARKSQLLARESRNVVCVDLPHTPAKELGPAEAYARAGEEFRRMLDRGVLTRRADEVMFAYRQTWTQPDSNNASTRVTLSRTGMACCVDTVAFGPRTGGGILPHEETFSGPKQDRLALMHATGVQLSPIFGLHADAGGRAREVLASLTSSTPDRVARTDDGTTHEIWTIEDRGQQQAYADAVGGEDVFIADGHHRYNTGLNYLNDLDHAGKLSTEHPARRTMMVLVGMRDPGLVIWPTHRVIGGMQAYTLETFQAAAGDALVLSMPTQDLRQLERTLGQQPSDDGLVVGVWDFATSTGFVARPKTSDPLSGRFPHKPAAWRTLGVAMCQHMIVEEICQAKLNGGAPVRWAFPHTIEEVLAIGTGAETGAGGGSAFGDAGAQIAVIVRPTPLAAVRDVSAAGELMPQKSTFFYPKLATGLFMHG